MGCGVWQLVFTSSLLNRCHTLHIDLLILKSFLRYLLTPYLVVIWACNGIRAKKMTDPLVIFNYFKTDLNIKLNRRFLRRSRTTCWRSWSSRGAPSWSGWSWSSGGCLGLLSLSYIGHPFMKYALRLQICCWFKIIMEPLADSYLCNLWSDDQATSSSGMPRGHNMLQLDAERLKRSSI